LAGCATPAPMRRRRPRRPTRRLPSVTLGGKAVALRVSGGLMAGALLEVPSQVVSSPPENRGPCGTTRLEGRTSRPVVFDGLCAGACVRRATEKNRLEPVFGLPARLLPPHPTVPRTVGLRTVCPGGAAGGPQRPMWSFRKRRPSNPTPSAAFASSVGLQARRRRNRLGKRLRLRPSSPLP
jgi:hypothetical protein